MQSGHLTIPQQILLGSAQVSGSEFVWISRPWVGSLFLWRPLLVYGRVANDQGAVSLEVASLTPLGAHH